MGKSPFSPSPLCSGCCPYDFFISTVAAVPIHPLLPLLCSGVGQPLLPIYSFMIHDRITALTKQTSFYKVYTRIMFYVGQSMWDNVKLLDYVRLYV